MAQIRELQNKANSLSDAREFYDPGSGSSSGATHVPDQFSAILSSKTWPRFDSGLPRDTLNGNGFAGNVFERLPAQGGLSSTIRNNSNSKERQEKGIIEHVDSITSLPNWKWNFESCWWNLFSRWYDGLSENPFYGMESWKFS